MEEATGGKGGQGVREITDKEDREDYQEEIMILCVVGVVMVGRDRSYNITTLKDY